MTYRILEANMERLTKKMNRIANKCKKYGCDFHFAEVGEEFDEITDEDGYTRTVRYILVEAEGVAQMNGWTFVATVEHTEKGNIIRKAIEVEVPERYYMTDPICEHCKSNRRRKDTYIVMNEDGEFKQVGKTCLKDFTNGMDAGWVASYTALFDELITAEAPMGCGWGEKYYEVEEYLRYAFETVHHFGYEKADGERECTKTRTADYYIAEHGGHAFSEVQDAVIAEMRRIGFDANREEITEEVEKALEWLAEQPEDSNYIHNLKTICDNKWFTPKNAGILVSLTVTYHKAVERVEKERKEAEAKAETKWVGEVGDRIEINVESFAVVTGWETQWGYTRIYKIIDTDGNIFTWKTSAWIEEYTTKIKGTIKEHKEYRGEKQTELTRCKCTVEAPKWNDPMEGIDDLEETA